MEKQHILLCITVLTVTAVITGYSLLWQPMSEFTAESLALFSLGVILISAASFAYAEVDNNGPVKVSSFIIAALAGVFWYIAWIVVIISSIVKLVTLHMRKD